MNPYEIYGSPTEERPNSRYGREEEPYSRPIESYRRISPGESTSFLVSLPSRRSHSCTMQPMSRVRGNALACPLLAFMSPAERCPSISPTATGHDNNTMQGATGLQL